MRNRSAPRSCPAGRFGRCKPKPFHELFWRPETTEVIDLCYQCGFDDRANSAQRLQCFDKWRQRPASHCLLNSLVRSIASSLRFLDADATRPSSLIKRSPTKPLPAKPPDGQSVQIFRDSDQAGTLQKRRSAALQQTHKSQISIALAPDPSGSFFGDFLTLASVRSSSRKRTACVGLLAGCVSGQSIKMS